jgi:hypothetical protein
VRSGVACARLVQLSQAAAVQLEHAAAAPGDGLVVGHQHQGRALLGVHGEHQVDDAGAGGGVEVAGRLVGEQQARLHGEGARDGDALLLAAGQMLGIMAEALRKPDARQHLLGIGARAVAPGQFQRQHDVLQRGERRQQLEGLEDEAEHGAAQRGACILVQRTDRCPASSTRPRVGTSRPASSPSSVDLPEPEAPTMATASPAMTLKEISCRIVKRPSPLGTSLPSDDGLDHG